MMVMGGGMNVVMIVIMIFFAILMMMVFTQAYDNEISPKLTISISHEILF